MSNQERSSVTFARREDIPLLLEMMSELAEFEKLKHDFRTTAENLERYGFGSDKVVTFLLGHYGEKAAGYAAFYPNYSTFLAKPGLYLEDLYVREQYRGAGVAQALFGFLCAEAKRRGWARIDGMALEWNERAHRYYQALGAERLDGWQHYRLSEKAIERLARRAERSK